MYARGWFYWKSSSLAWFKSFYNRAKKARNNIVGYLRKENSFTSFFVEDLTWCVYFQDVFLPCVCCTASKRTFTVWRLNFEDLCVLPISLPHANFWWLHDEKTQKCWCWRLWTWMKRFTWWIVLSSDKRVVRILLKLCYIKVRLTFWISLFFFFEEAKFVLYKLAKLTSDKKNWLQTFIRFLKRVSTSFLMSISLVIRNTYC